MLVGTAEYLVPFALNSDLSASPTTKRYEGFSDFPVVRSRRRHLRIFLDISLVFLLYLVDSACLRQLISEKCLSRPCLLVSGSQEGKVGGGLHNARNDQRSH